MNLKDLYIDFFISKGHKQIPSAPVVPENDPSVLFNTAGMQPLIPYLLGQPHPYGTRLCDYQKCVRTNDLDEVDLNNIEILSFAFQNYAWDKIILPSTLKAIDEYTFTRNKLTSLTIPNGVTRRSCIFS